MIKADTISIPTELEITTDRWWLELGSLTPDHELSCVVAAPPTS